MDTQGVLKLAASQIRSLVGHTFDVLSLAPPKQLAEALSIVKIISKVSPLVGNLIEYRIVELLNQRKEYGSYGVWTRQDPGLPDTVFTGSISPIPGLEVKTWFPLATEITARFKDSQTRFEDDQTHLVLLAWIPEFLIAGRPRLIDVCVIPCKSIALARDEHYHQPPSYVVVEPGNTTGRTKNLQQTNTSGYKWQDSKTQFKRAQVLVESWGKQGKKYGTNVVSQRRIRELMSKYEYRLDTNFAKVDRIEHKQIEEFKTRVLSMDCYGNNLRRWGKVLFGDTGESELSRLLESMRKQQE